MQNETWTPRSRRNPITKLTPEEHLDVLLLRNALQDALDSTAKLTMRPSKRAEAGITDLRRPSFSVGAHVGNGEFEGTVTRYLDDGTELTFECTFTYSLRSGMGRSGRRDITWTLVRLYDADEDELTTTTEQGMLPALPGFPQPEPEPEEIPDELPEMPEDDNTTLTLTDEEALQETASTSYPAQPEDMLPTAQDDEETQPEV